MFDCCETKVQEGVVRRVKGGRWPETEGEGQGHSRGGRWLQMTRSGWGCSVAAAEGSKGTTAIGQGRQRRLDTGEM